MEAQILDTRVEAARTCYLCRITLEDYLTSLPRAYQDYDIQRGIVSNVYLDHLVQTVLDKKHIPPIVLVVDKGKFSIIKGNTALSIKTFKILDGLQRTHRLKAIKDTVEFCKKRIPEDNGEPFNKFALWRLSLCSPHNSTSINV